MFLARVKDGQAVPIGKLKPQGAVFLAFQTDYCGPEKSHCTSSSLSPSWLWSPDRLAFTLRVAETAFDGNRDVIVKVENYLGAADGDLNDFPAAKKAQINAFLESVHVPAPTSMFAPAISKTLTYMPQAGSSSVAR